MERKQQKIAVNANLLEKSVELLINVCVCLMIVFDGSILPVQLTLSFFITSDEKYGFCFVYFNLLIVCQTQEKQHNFSIFPENRNIFNKWIKIESVL